MPLKRRQSPNRGRWSLCSRARSPASQPASQRRAFHPPALCALLPQRGSRPAGLFSMNDVDVEKNKGARKKAFYAHQTGRGKDDRLEICWKKMVGARVEKKRRKSGKTEKTEKKTIVPAEDNCRVRQLSPGKSPRRKDPGGGFYVSFLFSNSYKKKKRLQTKEYLRIMAIGSWCGRSRGPQ